MTVSYTAWWARQSVSAVLNVTPDIATINQGSQSSILGVNPTTTATVRRLFGAASTSTLSPSLSGDADLTRVTSGSLVVVPEVSSEMVSLVSGAAIVSPQSTAEAVRTRFASATMNVVPAATVAMQRGNDLGAALTVTPAISAGRQFKAVGTGQLNATPSVAAQANSLQLINSSLPVSPAIVAGAVAGLTGAVNAVPSISAEATSSSAVSATVNAAPTVSGAASPIRLVSASATVTPVLDAQRIYTASGAALVLATPAFDPQTVASAKLLGSMSATASVNPTVAAGAVSGNTSTLSAVPVITAAGTRIKIGTATVGTTPTLASSGLVTHPASIAMQASPSTSATAAHTAIASATGGVSTSISASATVIPATPAGPAFDAVGTGGVNGNYSWQHEATDGALVLVWVAVGPGDGPSSVTYGDGDMALVGDQYPDNFYGYGDLQLWAMPEAPGGVQDVTLSGQSAYCTANSVSYTGFTGNYDVGGIVWGHTQLASQSATCTSGQLIAQAFMSSGYDFAGTSGGSNRFNGDTYGFCGLVINDALSTTTFTATQSGASADFAQWAGLAIIIY